VVELIAYIPCGGKLILTIVMVFSCFMNYRQNRDIEVVRSAMFYLDLSSTCSPNGDNRPYSIAVPLTTDWQGSALVGWGEFANPNTMTAQFVGVPAVTPTYRTVVHNHLRSCWLMHLNIDNTNTDRAVKIERISVFQACSEIPPKLQEQGQVTGIVGSRNTGLDAAIFSAVWSHGYTQCTQ
jgi:hypothetical protein